MSGQIALAVAAAANVSLEGRFVAGTLALLLTACGVFRPDPRERAEQCVAKQVPKGSKVSAAEARRVVNNCTDDISKWLDAAMRRTCSGACNYSDPYNVKYRRKV